MRRKEIEKLKAILKSLKIDLIEYINSFTIYDYVAFGWLVFLLFVIFILIVLLARKKPKLAIFLTLISILLIFIAPFGIKYFLDQSVRKVEVVATNITKLNFAPSLIIKGYIKNLGKIDFKKCQIDAKVIKLDKNRYKNSINFLKPLRVKTIYIDKNITKGKQEMFKIVIDDFKYKGDFNVTLSGVCY